MDTLSNLYLKLEKKSEYLDWQEKIITTEAMLGDQSTGYTKSLAAKARLLFAEEIYIEYDRVKLKVPLQNNIKKMHDMEEKHNIMMKKME